MSKNYDVVIVKSKNNLNLFRKVHSDIIEKLSKIKIKSNKEIENLFYKEINRLQEDDEKLSSIDPIFCLMNTGGYACIFYYIGYIIRIVSSEKTFSKLGSEKIPVNILGFNNNQIRNFIQIPELLFYNDKIYNILYEYCNMYTKLLRLIADYFFPNKKLNTKEKILDFVFSSKKTTKLLIYLESTIISNDIINASNVIKNNILLRFLDFFQTRDINRSILVELHLKAIGDASHNIIITLKYINQFIFQILLTLYIINKEKLFLHGDLKINNILIYPTNNDSLVVQKFGDIENDICIKSKYNFVISDFDLSKLYDYNSKSITDFKTGWLYDITFLINSLISNVKIKETNPEMFNFLYYNILKGKEFKNGKLIKCNKEDYDLKKLSDLINDSFFDEFKINN